MRYRMEASADEFLIRNEETNRTVGYVIPFSLVKADQTDSPLIQGCTVYNNEHEEIATLSTAFVANPMELPAIALANHEAWFPRRWKRESASHFGKASDYGLLRVRQNGLGTWTVCRNGRYLMERRGCTATFATAVQAKRAADVHLGDDYPGSRCHRDGRSWEQGGGPEPERVEERLGILLGDAASALAQGLVEYGKGGLNADRFAELVAQISEIWLASLYNSFESDRRVWEPYFIGAAPSHLRLSFSAAAQHYGRAELRSRFPGVDEATLVELLSDTLDLLRRSLVTQ